MPMSRAYEMIDGSRSSCRDDTVTDELIRGGVGTGGDPTRHRIGTTSNVFVQDDGVPWLIDFGFSEVAVADEILDADVQRRCWWPRWSSAPKPYVRGRIDRPEAVGDALARLQMAAG